MQKQAKQKRGFDPILGQSYVLWRKRAFWLVGYYIILAEKYEKTVRDKKENKKEEENQRDRGSAVTAESNRLWKMSWW